MLLSLLCFVFCHFLFCLLLYFFLFFVLLFFFFQAEDGIRDWSVTGVQTCALPISPANRDNERLDALDRLFRLFDCLSGPER